MLTVTLITENTAGNSENTLLFQLNLHVPPDPSTRGQQANIFITHKLNKNELKHTFYIQI